MRDELINVDTEFYRYLKIFENFVTKKARTIGAEVERSYWHKFKRVQRGRNIKQVQDFWLFNNCFSFFSKARP
jgi:hypothetical protein